MFRLMKANGLAGSLLSFFWILADLIRPIMMMAVTERDTSAAPTAPTIGDNAPDEFARIVSVAVFKTSVDVSAWDANTDTEWDALETAGDMFIIGPVRGMLSEPSANNAPGYGFLQSRRKNHSWDIPFAHLSSKEDVMLFWDTVMDQPGDWSAMFVFEDMTGYFFAGKDLIPVAMNFNARPASESEDIGDERRVMINAQFLSKRLPYQLDLSGAAAANFKLN